MPTIRPSAHAITLAAAACSLAALAMFVAPAISLLGYRWDWSPDEGLTLDYGRRVLEAPGTLYAKSAVPFPSAWGPVLPVVVAPAVATTAPLFAARVIAMAWTAATAAGVFVLVRRQGQWPAALAASALALADLDLAFFHLILRPDGLLVTLWTWAAVALLPLRLERGADRLSTSRLVAGSVLLLVAVLVKAAAAVHGAPLALGWLLVDRRSAFRLLATLAAGGGAAVALLQWATDGGFLWVSGLWGHHDFVPGQTAFLLGYVALRAWPLLLLALVGFLLARRAGAAPERDSGLLLALGALLILPALGKFGASWNYLLPFLAALAVLAGRFFARVGASTGVGALLLSGVALGTAATSRFPLPSAEDERTARSFYAMVTSITARAQAPILALRPELAYFLVGQPTEAEGSGFESLVAHDVAGTRSVLEGVRARRYGLVVVMWNFPSTEEWVTALGAGYERIAVCSLGYYFGRFDARIFSRADLAVRVRPPEDSRCGASL